MKHAFEGKHYNQTKHLPIKSIAKLVKADLRKAMPGKKVGVTSEAHRGWEALTIYLHGIPNDQREKPYNAAYALAEQYTYNDSDPVAGHYDFRFAIDIQFPGAA